MAFRTKYDGKGFIPSWAKTAGAIRDHGTLVMVTCGRCQWTRKPIEIQPIIDKFGPDFELWDRRPHCPRCNHRMLFMCAPAGPMTPMRPMLSR